MGETALRRMGLKRVSEEQSNRGLDKSYDPDINTVPVDLSP